MGMLESALENDSKRWQASEDRSTAVNAFEEACEPDPDESNQDEQV